MIKYAIVSSGVPDNDGQFSVGIRVTKQDEDQIAISGTGNLVFRAKNGWSVISGKVVEIHSRKKMIAIMGAYWTGTYMHGIGCQHKANEDAEYLATKEEAETVKKEIEEAIAEWVENGGFDKIQVQGDGEEPIQEKFTGEYKYEVRDYYQWE